MIAALIFDSTWQWWLFAALAFLYGSGILVAVVVTLVKSARKQWPNEEKRN